MKNVFLLEERDSWYSNMSAVKLGVFSTYNKALKAAIKEYGKLQEDGTIYHLEPIKDNDLDLRVYISKINLNMFEEIN